MALREEGYWDKHYELELINYEEDKDEGEVWFGKGLNKRIVDWILQRLLRMTNDQEEIAVLDVGCGNAYTICTLGTRWSEMNIESNNRHRLKIMGLDYSANSIELAKKITHDRGLSNSITLKQCDFLDKNQLTSNCGRDKFDFIIDKGTFDAICLLASNSTSDVENAKLKYKESLNSLAREGTVFILASCNYTEEELQQVFVSESDGEYTRVMVGKIETPTLKFGGKLGSQVTCLILQSMRDLNKKDGL